jgi:hypothetical protein
MLMNAGAERVDQVNAERGNAVIQRNATAECAVFVRREMDGM